MSTQVTKSLVMAAIAIAAVAWQSAHAADKKYGPGVSDSEIKLGQTVPYSGPYSSFGVMGSAEIAYFKMINDRGGVNGRKINLVSLDDEYSPPKTLAQTRKLVESEQVLAIVGPVGGGTVLAARKYLNDNKVPQVFAYTGLSSLGDPVQFPWSMGWLPTNHTEAAAYAKYVMRAKPTAKIAVLYQQGEAGKDFYKGVVDGLGEKGAKMLIKVATYEATDPTVDSQIISLQASGADTLIEFSGPKTAAQSIRKAFDIGWKPLHFITYSTASIGAVLAPAGEKSIGVMSSAYLKDPTDSSWANDAGSKEILQWKAKYMPGADLSDLSVVSGYAMAEAIVQVIKQCGDDLTRENFMKQVAGLRSYSSPIFLPGVVVNTGPADYFPIKTLRLQQYDGKKWVLLPPSAS
jgi:branched-chain amino acid transport system substrate-binding protein